MNGKSGLRSLLLLTAILTAVLLVLFWKSLNVSTYALFSNDGPMGVQLSRPLAMPQAFFGIWNDNYWLGAYNGNYNPNFSGLIYAITPGMGRVNFYTPLSILVLGLCAWVFFRRIGCNSRSAILAALAAALNMNFFSNAAWGLGSRGLSLAGAFLALAAIETGIALQPLLTSILAGLALGLCITEGGDNGAFFSMFIGTFALWRTWIAIPSRGKAAAWSLSKVAIMIVFAAIMASQTLGVFARTAVKGIVGTTRDNLTKEQKWDGNTMWSLPKIETLRVIIPGVFGYHMLPYAHSPEQSYWGSVGQDPQVPKLMPQLNDPDPNVRQQVANFIANSYRSSGAGEYAGVLVVLVAIWAFVEALRKKGQTFTATERKIVLFWAVAAIVAMCLGWGRHAPFYRLIYALPYFSTIRNPMKFFHVFDMCLMILFAYGLLGLNRRYLDIPAKGNSLFAQLKAWWVKAPAPEKLWTWGCIAAVTVAIVAWFGYMGSKPAVIRHLTETGFSDPEVARSIAGFSIQEVFLFAATLIVCVTILTFIISGAFAGPRATWAALILGAVLVIDLARADMPWIKYDEWKQQYAPNPVFNILADKPYEHRVAVPRYQLNQQFGMLQNIYHGDWIQRPFPYFHIQSIDIPQEPRPPADKQAYREALGVLYQDTPTNVARYWQLTNTRYLFGLAGLADMFNQQIDPVRKGFRQRATFTFFQKPGSHYIGVETNATGPFALLEFTGALPRAKLYNDWETIDDEKKLLSKLGDPTWDPIRSVLLSDAAPKPTAANAAPGKAEILSNPSTKLMEIQTTSDAPGMLLLNDKLEPEWRAYVDGKETPVLRANYLMRAVSVPAGSHKVVFKYEMKPSGFFLVLACDSVGLALVGIVAWSAKRKHSVEVAKNRKS